MTSQLIRYIVLREMPLKLVASRTSHWKVFCKKGVLENLKNLQKNHHSGPLVYTSWWGAQIWNVYAMPKWLYRKQYNELVDDSTLKETYTKLKPLLSKRWLEEVRNPRSDRRLLQKKIQESLNYSKLEWGCGMFLEHY